MRKPKQKQKQKRVDPALRERARRIARGLRLHDREVLVQPDGTRVVTVLYKDQAEQDSFGQKLIALADMKIFYRDASALSRSLTGSSKGGKEKARLQDDPTRKSARKHIKKLFNEGRDREYMRLELKRIYKFTKPESAALVKNTVKTLRKKIPLL